MPSPRAKLEAAPSAAPDSSVGDLVAECLARLSDAGPAGADAIYDAHPELATTLRRRVERIAGMGWLQGGAERSEVEIPGFELLGTLGHGGMGEVYLARQLHPVRRSVAVKVIKPGMDTEQVVARFEAERQALASMNHPGIATVHDAGRTAAGRPWFAMEYVPGVPLWQWVREERCTLRQRLELLLEVCDAVEHAHQVGIVHRDLKPSNILVGEYLDRPRVKIIDFGLAKAMAEASGGATLLTEIGQLLGTPEYMSPEQVDAGIGRIDTRTDVYALGVILYELLTELLPFASSELRDKGYDRLRALICETQPLPPSRRVQRDALSEEAARQMGWTRQRLRRALEGDLDWIVQRAMAAEPDRRYATVGELAEDVRAHLDDRPVRAGPPSRRYILGKFVRRNRAALAVTSAAVVGVVVFAVTTWLLYRSSEQNATQARHSLGRFDLMLDTDRLREYLAEADTKLWPEVPERIPEFEDWLRRAAELVARRPAFDSALEELKALQANRAAWVAASAPGLHSRDRDPFLLAQLQPQVEAWDALESVVVPNVRRRLAWARRIEAATLSDAGEAWAQAIADIADRTRNPHYGGIEIAPQRGLVPLERDPDSGLWEFALARPGMDLPQRGPDGAWQLTPTTCLVLVLIPGGEYLVGAQAEDPTGANFDPQVLEREGPVVAVRLDPYFLAKYELSQAQWLALVESEVAGEPPSNPAAFAPGPKYGRFELTVHHPVEFVSQAALLKLANSLGLGLPSGAQWEVAARGGVPGARWFGTDPEAIGASANILDQTGLDGGMSSPDGASPEIRDGYVLHAPVDTGVPNPFGLYHILGNVWEWCVDCDADLAVAPPRDGDGRQIDATVPRIQLRGGSFGSPLSWVRATARLTEDASVRKVSFGARFSRPCTLQEER